tara:strand:- start:4264 stop:5634 length:1371 start_codon:yes stop_codon:yes gene_type:complete
MCGLVGYAGRYRINRERMFKDMLLMDIIRGHHSTGVSLISKNFKKTNKITGDAVVLLQHKLTKKMFKKPSPIYLGHNRFATTGKINQKNAHPFTFGNITGAHNGTLRGVHLLEDEKKFDVDSKAILNAINKKGIEKTWSLLHGAAALSWYDAKEKSINLIRNHERPLFYAYLEDKLDGVFWASETWILESAAARNKVDIGDTYVCTPSTHYKFKINFEAKFNEDFITRHQHVLKPYVLPAVTYGNYGHWNDNLNYGMGRVWSSEKNCFVDKDEDQSILPFKPPSSDFKKLKGVVVNLIPKRKLRFGAVTSDHSGMYIECDVKGEAGLRARIPIEKGKEGDVFYNLIGAIPEVLIRGKLIHELKGLYNIWLVDKKTVEIVEHEEEDEDPLLKKCFEGEMLNEVQFDNRYKSCGFCDDWLNFWDHEIEFVSYTDAICGECVDINSQHQQMIDTAGVVQ